MAKRGKTQVVGEKATFEMDVRQSNEDDPIEIAVEMDFTGVSRNKLIEWCCAGSSRRVVLQAALRKLPEKKLLEMSEKGLKVAATSCTDLKTAEEKRQEMINAMSDEEKKALAEMLTKSLSS
jgi:hypothetical protein